jgi:outer membrane protein
LAILLYATGLPAETRLQLAEEKQPPQADAMASLANWLDEATVRHPAILAARAQLEAARAKVDVVRSQGLPTLDFNGNYYQNGYPNQGLQPTRSATTTVGVTLTIPLFEGFARTYQIRGAQAQVDQSEAQLRDTELQVLTTIVKDHAEASATLANLGSSTGWLDAAQDAVSSARRRYDKGAADILELLTAESALSDARQERVRCISEWRSARLRLLADAGVLGRRGVESDGSSGLDALETDRRAVSP